MSTIVKATIDHHVIRGWAEARQGFPARVRPLSESGRSERLSGMLRIDFWGNDRTLEPMDWESFFIVFDHNEFVFLYQDDTDVSESRFYSIISRRPSDAHPHPVKEALRTANRRFAESSDEIDETELGLESDWLPADEARDAE